MTDRKPPLLVHGMHGMGDNLHQRAVVRQLMDTHEVWLETSWVALYHDLIAEGLHVVRKHVALRTQLKNQSREQAKFVPSPRNLPDLASVSLSYSGHNVARQPNRTILEALLGAANMRLSYECADFSLPVPPEWGALVPPFDTGGKPLLVYRPLVLRPEWRGNDRRNADADAYAQIFAAIRDRFFVVSVADLEPGREWITGPRLKPDATFHKGELPFEALAALFARAKMVYTSSGFAVLLAQSVGTPVVSVLGLYERGDHHAAGAKYAPYLAIEPINPCSCQNSFCPRRCSKQIDLHVAISKITDFVNALGVPYAERRPMAEMFDPPANEPRISAMQGPRFRPIYKPGDKGLRA